MTDALENGNRLSKAKGSREPPGEPVPGDGYGYPEPLYFLSLPRAEPIHWPGCIHIRHHRKPAHGPVCSDAIIGRGLWVPVDSRTGAVLKVTELP